MLMHTVFWLFKSSQVNAPGVQELLSLSTAASQWYLSICVHPDLVLYTYLTSRRRQFCWEHAYPSSCSKQLIEGDSLIAIACMPALAQSKGICDIQFITCQIYYILICPWHRIIISDTYIYIYILLEPKFFNRDVIFQVDTHKHPLDEA